ncbi:hypothetical protein EKO04_010166 [Ascochyta lentis]|uniref:Uncharacterized protein n=1 Tax=Ascochyta lentis TaxID=205686 RepID=A0A8H7MDG8_9PLEO|nr:hypothetical protein EKO04_010166 [Ascochyta lentis]
MEELFGIGDAMDGEPTATDRRDALQDCRFHDGPIIDALNGVAIPKFLGLEVVQRCVIRGIRYHDHFAAELRGLTPQFTRALNAQAIMNNRVPDMQAPEEFPYCIWHPRTPSQETCRALLQRYPQMAYHIGRVCAVAAYTDLYCELNLLPEVHIAEEARDNGSRAIFDAIIDQPVKYAVFNDYERLYEPHEPKVAALNGETCVRSMLELKQRYGRPSPKHARHWTYGRTTTPGFEVHRFDITEDMCIDTYTSDRNAYDLIDQDVVIPLLYSPLPADLPTLQKDVLILAAALHGDIDRYVRLRRPYRIDGELSCIVRGIYHFPMFAKWCSLQKDKRLDHFRIRAAITARFIMSSDLSRITPETPQEDLPYCIWFPQLACPTTYEKLALLRPDMRLQVARACIVADYKEVYQKINPSHDIALVKEAEVSPNPYYLQDLESKALTDSTGDLSINYENWKRYTIKDARKASLQSPESVLAHIGPGSIDADQPWVYDGFNADFRQIEVTICASDEIRQQEREKMRHLEEIWTQQDGHI